jgi:hypothetical protein
LPELLTCPDKLRLFKIFTESLNRFIESQRGYLARLNAGKADVWHVDSAMVAANHARKVSRDAYLRHIKEHG